MAAMLPKLFFVHFRSTSFAAVGYDGEGEDCVTFAKDLATLGTEP